MYLTLLYSAPEAVSVIASLILSPDDDDDDESSPYCFCSLVDGTKNSAKYQQSQHIYLWAVIYSLLTTV